MMRDFWFLLTTGAFIAGWTHTAFGVLLLVMWWYTGLMLELWDGREHV